MATKSSAAAKPLRRPAEVSGERKRRWALRRKLLAARRQNPDKRIILVQGRVEAVSKRPKPKRYKIRVVDRNSGMIVNIIENRRVDPADRRVGQRRSSQGERRSVWISGIEPKMGKDGYYHIEYHNRVVERRKIIDYMPVEDGFLCITDGRKGFELRGKKYDRRGPGGIKPHLEGKAVKEGEHPGEPAGWRTLGKLERQMKKESGKNGS